MTFQIFVACSRPFQIVGKAQRIGQCAENSEKKKKNTEKMGRYSPSVFSLAFPSSRLSPLSEPLEQAKIFANRVASTEARERGVIFLC